MSEEQNQRLASKITETIMPEIQQQIDQALAEGRAEARREAAKKIRGIAIRNVNGSMIVNMEAALNILADESKESEAEIPDTGRRVRCNHCMSEFDEAYIDINATNHDSGETCPVCGKGDALMDLERKLKEAER